MGPISQRLARGGTVEEGEEGPPLAKSQGICRKPAFIVIAWRRMDEGLQPPACFMHLTRIGVRVWSHP